MKVIITEHQYNLIFEQPDSKMPFQIEKSGYKQSDPSTLRSSLKMQQQVVDSLYDLTCAKAPDLCIFLAQSMLWITVPYIGPYVASALGTQYGVHKLKSGKPVEGIIEIITSPLSLSKFIWFMKFKYPYEKVIIQNLKMIQKSGIPLLYEQGMQAFYTWMKSKFDGTFVDIFFKSLISAVKHDMIKNTESRLKEKISEWKRNHPNEYSNLKPDQKKLIDKVLS